MSGYLQRLAMSVLKPGGNIRPLQGSVFAPTEAVAGHEVLPEMETRPTIAAGSDLEPEPSKSPRESAASGHNQEARTEGFGARASQRAGTSEEPGEPRSQTVEILVPPADEVPSPSPDTVVSADPVSRREPEPPRELRNIQTIATQKQRMEDPQEEMTGRQDFPKSAGSTSNPPPQDARKAIARTEPAEIQTRPAAGFQVPRMATPLVTTTVARSEAWPRNGPQSSHHDPVIPSFPTSPPGPKGRPVVESQEPQVSKPVGSLTPLVPVQTGIPAARPGFTERSIVPPEALREAKPGQGGQTDSGFGDSAVTVEMPSRQAGGAEEVKPKAKASLVPIVQTEFRSLPPGPVAAAAGGRAEAGYRRPEPARREPDDIQIQIGRIEVVAAPPRRPVAPKPRRGASSLGEYLRRRDGKLA